ncbi:four helix bundle suffix domain-containing protein [Chitinispirillales bacterium ANBcel5]|uniref:four helix bundle suffix domain-containing protein n=1 Tax=Cellulosispirillum alkaliphilum TaxID=3039283 RepID=UPI002A56F671|nr:four helix bundle suffix domain-containing protein [Chitinispirillales bacterium ANBcel5]
MSRDPSGCEVYFPSIFTMTPAAVSSFPSIPGPNFYSERMADAVLVLIGVACSLLDRQVDRLAKDFLNEGGFTERLYKIRRAKRNQKKPTVLFFEFQIPNFSYGSPKAKLATPQRRQVASDWFLTGAPRNVLAPCKREGVGVHRVG